MNNQRPRYTFGTSITVVIVAIELLMLGPVALVVALPLVFHAMFAWKWDRLLSQLMLGSLSLIHLTAVYLDYRTEFLTNHPNAQAGIGLAVASYIAIPILVISWFGIGIYNAKANHQATRIFY